MSIQGIGAQIVNGGIATGAYVKEAATLVGTVALGILKNLPWIGEYTGAAASTLPAWAVGTISIGVGLTAIAGLGLLVKYYVIPLFAAKAEAQEA